MKKMVLIGITFQILVLLSFIVFAYVPLYFGDEIKVKATGFDPRDILLGNYVRLDYPELRDFEFNEKLDKYEKIFVVLQKDKGLYKAKFVTKERPKDEIYLSGRALYTSTNPNIEFGIERYYLPKKDALNMEKKLNNEDAIVTLGVFRGFARIKKIEFEFWGNKYFKKYSKIIRKHEMAKSMKDKDSQ